MATGIEKKVCEDIEKRQELGISKYGTSVADNPLSLRQWVQHAYEECLDQAIYLRKIIEEVDKISAFPSIDMNSLMNQLMESVSGSLQQFNKDSSGDVRK